MEIIQREYEVNQKIQKQIILLLINIVSTDTDTLFFDMIQSVPAIKTFPILCQNKNTARMACITPKCPCHGFLCAKVDCKSCENKHLKCKTIWLDNIMNKLQNKLQIIPEGVHQGIQQLDRVYSEAIKKLEQKRNNLHQQSSLYGLGFQQINLINKLKQDSFHQIEGDTLSKIYKNIGISQQIRTNSQALKKYWKKKNNQFQNFLKKITEISRKDWRNFSDIIENDKSKIQKLFPDNNITNIQLLYRASEHQFQIGPYHKLCDNIENTLVLVKTQFGKIIGGFTPVKLGQQPGYLPDPSNRTFLFSITQDKVISCVNPNIALCYNANMGPAFATDFVINNKANIMKQSQCLLASYYIDQNASSNLLSGPKFTGSNSNAFGIEQWEVFKLTFDKPLEKKESPVPLNQTPFGLLNNAFGTAPFGQPMGGLSMGGLPMYQPMNQPIAQPPDQEEDYSDYEQIRSN